MVLSRVQVSFAYPMLSIGYVVNALAAYYLFGEPLTSLRMLGIFIIITGVYLVAQTLKLKENYYDRRIFTVFPSDYQSGGNR